MNRINSFLELAVKQGGSDLHLISGQPPRVRINGLLHRIRFRDLSVDDMQRILDEFMTENARRRFEESLSVDFAYEVSGLGRFRVNVYRHHYGLAATLRVVPARVPDLDELGLPQVVKATIAQPKGLTLVTGPTGAGKSTTLAAMIDQINATRRGHIVTLEDPIEFLHSYKQCVVTQREIGTDAPNFTDALRHATREDPDVIMVGELRDSETVALALTAAETGVQVLGTLHTNGAVRGIDRLVNAFPEKRQEQVRAMLSESLRMVVSQQLVRTADESRRVAVAEVLLNTPAASSVIRSGQSHKLMSVIQAGRRLGMQSLDTVLKELVLERKVSARDAYERAIERSQFERYLVREEAA
jgi:twitching motility protein PilT